MNDRERESFSIADQALRLIKENPAPQYIDKEKKFRVSLSHEATQAIINLLTVRDQRLFPGEVADSIDGEILGSIVNRVLTSNPKLRVSFDINYQEVHRIGSWAFSEIDGEILGQEPYFRNAEHFRLRQMYTSRERAAAFLDLNEAFMMAGGTDVKPVRLAVEKIVSA